LIKISDFLSQEKSSVKINGLSIRGRNEMCLNETLLSLNADPRESMSVCSDLRKNKNCIHFLNLLNKKDKVDNPILIAPEKFNSPFDADVLIDICKEKKLCPYFLSKFLLQDMRVIICNYQWIFNPFIRQSFLKFIGKELKDCILVIDECHNVIDVATEMNSFRITPYSLRLCLRDLELYRARSIMQRFVNILLTHLDKKKKSLIVNEKAINPQKLLNEIIIKMGLNDVAEFKSFLTDMYDLSTSIHEERVANGEISRDYLGSLADFWYKWIESLTLESYFFSYNISSKNEKRNISMEIIALDPREISIPILKSCYASLHLSGTVNPYVYNNLLGLNQSGKLYKAIIAKSPFLKKNIKVLITEGIDTRRENRTTSMYKKIIKKIDEVLYCTPANVGIFCASYKVLNALLNDDIKAIVKRNNKKLFFEEPGFSASENSLMIEDFKSMSKSKDKGGVLLGVCGGRNSEGEDYPGETMNGVIIVGVPYHLPTPRINAKISYYDKVFDKQGWNFAYLYPAMQRANQASGRPIRKLTDKGSIIFMDSRFKQKYQWISDWIKTSVEIITDKKNAIIQNLYPFWHK